MPIHGQDIDTLTPAQAAQQLVMNYTMHLSSCCSRDNLRQRAPEVACDCGLLKLLHLAGLEPVDYPSGDRAVGRAAGGS